MLAFVLAASACAPTPVQRAEADMASVRQETNAGVLVERGRGFATVGDHTRAEEYLAAAMDAGADPRDVLPLLMEVCVRTGRYRSAIQHGENHLRNHPNDLQTRVVVAALYVAINEGTQAREHLEHVLSKPEEVVNRVELGQDKARASNGSPAGNVTPVPFGKNGHAEPLYAQAHYLLAVVARDKDKDVVEADRHFREYLRIEPRGSHAAEAKASLLTRVP